MKKLLCFLMILTVIFSFCSCGGNRESFDKTLFDESFREKNDTLFLREDCEHWISYVPASSIFEALDDSIYHAVVCKRGSCDFETHYEPHTINISGAHLGNDKPHYAENGYFYHDLYVSCALCRKSIKLNIYCESQDKNCSEDTPGNKCFEERDWREILCGTPYEISGG